MWWFGLWFWQLPVPKLFTDTVGIVVSLHMARHIKEEVPW